MASITRKGNIPVPTTGLSDYVDEIFTIGGFFGPWASIYRHHNLAHPVDCSDPNLVYQGLNSDVVLTAGPADGTAVTILKGTSNAVALARPRLQTPVLAEKLVDRHQIRFYHRGRFALETELGPLAVGPGDFVVIPASMIYRETPLEDDGVVVIFETEAAVCLAESLWDSVGYAGMFVDYSELELPEPAGNGAAEERTRVRIRYDDEWHWMDFDFDPCNDAVGWLGDPIVYKLNAWSIPGIGTTSGFLTPPANAVLWDEGKSWFFNVLGPRPFPATPPPRGSYGAPSHMNDYDEVWFNHASEFAQATNGDLWLLPRTIPHPGLKRPPEYPANPVKQIEELKLNFDTKDKLRWTEAGLKVLFPNPQVALYTSLYGAHIGVVPETATRYVKK